MVRCLFINILQEILDLKKVKQQESLEGRTPDEYNERYLQLRKLFEGRRGEK